MYKRDRPVRTNLPEKDRSNTTFVDLVANHTVGPIYAVVLDGEFCRTSRAMLSRTCVRRRLNRCFVPEHDETLNGKKPTLSKVTHVATSDIHDAFVGSNAFRPMRKTPRMNAAYFDFCSTVTGDRSRRVFPLESVRYFLRHLASKTENVVFAATFSTRMRTGLDSKYANVRSEILHAFVRPLLAECQFYEKKRIVMRQYRQDKTG